jgi:oxygen-independent coproporphyrinogen-3 oxidase
VAPQTDDRAAEEVLAAHERLTAAGYEHYEVSNYARPGYRSRHNSAYWRRVPYIGIGPSAHSYDGVARRWNIAAYAAWEAALARGLDPAAGAEQLTAAERAAEEAYLGLRTDAGLTLTSAGDVATARTWVRAGWAMMTGDHVRFTPEGWLRLDALVGSLGPLSH